MQVRICVVVATSATLPKRTQFLPCHLAPSTTRAVPEREEPAPGARALRAHCQKKMRNCLLASAFSERPGCAQQTPPKPPCACHSSGGDVIVRADGAGSRPNTGPSGERAAVALQAPPSFSNPARPSWHGSSLSPSPLTNRTRHHPPWRPPSGPPSPPACCPTRRPRQPRMAASRPPPPPAGARACPRPAAQPRGRPTPPAPGGRSPSLAGRRPA